MLLNPELNCLAGASFSLKKGVENIMNFTDSSLTNAINMASRNVARVFSLDDRGKLVPGNRADIILFEKVNNMIRIKETWLNGELVFHGE